MLEIKANKGTIRQNIKGSTREILVDLALVVRATIRAVAENMKKSGVDTEEFADLRTRMNLVLMESVAHGINDAEKPPVFRGGINVWEEEP